ncbi:MAG: homoserine dehydrogenase [Brevundimonas sp.]
MTAALSPLPRPVPGADAIPHVPDEPVALLQLDAADVADAASAVYREIRRGRRVVAVASGGSDAVARLAGALDAIGVSAARPDPGQALLDAPVSIVAGPEVAIHHPRTAPEHPLRVALAGCGVVGGGVLARLLTDDRFAVVGVLVRDPSKPRDPAVPEGLLLSDPAALLAREPDVLVEAISDASTGLALIRAALSRGVDVLSANKQAVGSDLAALTALAEAHDARLLYSASVGGGSPLIETVRRARAHGAVVRIEAVLNGSCNFILNRLARGALFDDALVAAREAGFAEEDPSADLSGLDAAAKLAILAHEALGRGISPERIARESLSADAAVLAGRVRQLSRLDARTGSATVALTAVDGDALFADLPDEWNALRVTTDDGRVFTARGRGAGRIPTTESVWADLTDLLTA